MTGLKERYRIAAWISDELLGRLSVEDEENLSAWRNSSTAHEEEYQEIKMRLKIDLRKVQRLDSENEWRDWKKRLPHKGRSLPWWYYVAAVVAIVIFSWGVVRQKQEVRSEYINHHLAGQKTYRATLVLNDGRKINIGDSLRKNIPLDKGIIVDSANRIKYEMQQQEESLVEYNTVEVPRGAEYEVCLADGTLVWLNSESRLTYPVRFNGNERCVEMVGEVCFQVTKDEHKPFIVKTGDVAVTVLGTLFNVEAYPENEKVVTTLVEGKVKVEYGGCSCLLNPDCQVVAEGGGLVVKEIIAKDYISWINGFFHFEESSLGDIMTKLARWYDVEFFFANSTLEDAHFSLDICRYENIATILSKIEKTGRVHFAINGKTVVVEE